MKTIINGIEFEGTPKELKEFLDLHTEIKIQQSPIVNLEKPRMMITSTGPKSLITIPQKRIGSGNRHGRDGCVIYTISMINGKRVKYTNQSLCAKLIGANQSDISKKKNTGLPVNGYYITTKEA